MNNNEIEGQNSIEESPAEVEQKNNEVAADDKKDDHGKFLTGFLPTLFIISSLPLFMFVSAFLEALNIPTFVFLVFLAVVFSILSYTRFFKNKRLKIRILLSISVFFFSDLPISGNSYLSPDDTVSILFPFSDYFLRLSL